MNLLEANVIEILSKPEFKYGAWFVTCTVNCYGRESNHDAMFRDKDKANDFKVGDIVII